MASTASADYERLLMADLREAAVHLRDFDFLAGC
jgi:hypothetical protein